MKKYLEPSLVIAAFQVRDILTTSDLSDPEATEDNGIEMPDIEIPG